MIEIISTYLLPVLLLGTIAYLLRVLAKIHANAKSIDSPDSIIQQLKTVQAELATLRRATETGHRETVSSVIRLQDEGFRKLVDDSLKRSETSAGIQGNLARLFGEQATRFAEIEAILGAIREQASNADQQLRRFQD